MYAAFLCSAAFLSSSAAMLWAAGSWKIDDAWSAVSGRFHQLSRIVSVEEKWDCKPAVRKVAVHMSAGSWAWTPFAGWVNHFSKKE